jgi:ATP-binding protein involved in chromosome partitioning
MSSTVTREKLLEVLSAIPYPDAECDVVSAGKVSGMVVRAGQVGFVLDVGNMDEAARDSLRIRCEKVAAGLEGVEKVTVILTAEREPSPANANPSPEDARKAFKEKNKAERLANPPAPVTGVKKIILIASGKGGVGKSTVAVNLAVALAQLGKRVGVVDADIYGPSIPMMLGLKGKPTLNAENKIVPFNEHGVKALSIGSLVAEDSAIAWRGSMATKALHQLIRGVAWQGEGEEPLDILLIDTPPGTGDIHLSLSEHYPIDGVVVVSTPQAIALADAKKAVDLYQKVNVPLLGIIENMSYFEDPTSKARTYIFGQGGAKAYAEYVGVPLLGEIPLNPAIREGGDEGKPAALGDDGLYKAIAAQLAT